MFCTACGVQNDEGSKFCKQCGAALTQAHTTQSETTFVTPAPQTKPGKKQSVWIAVRISFVLFWTALLTMTRRGFSAEAFGGWIGTLLLPLLLAFLCSKSWQKGRRVEFSHWFLGFGLVIPLLAVHHNLSDMSRPDLTKQLIGVSATDPELPADQQKIVSVSRLIFADMKSFRASQDERQAEIAPALATLDTASSFATLPAMKKCVHAVNEQLNIDQTTSLAFEDWPSKVRVQLDRTDLKPDVKRDI